jgi:cephalosporin-C deacetylase-like acetyl esterase
VDYLKSRDDIDKNKLSYYEFSMGGLMALLVLSIGNRLKTGVLCVAGLPR